MSVKNGKILVEVVDENGLPSNVQKNPNTGVNELMVNLGSHECPDNTTSDVLLAGETYTGTDFQDMLDYGCLTISVNTDTDSALDGLKIAWSQDGICECGQDTFSISANVPKTFTFGPVQRYYRVVYTNGPVDQGIFRLTSIIRKGYVKPSSHRIQDSIVAEDDGELVKAVITGVKPNGEFSNANLTSKSNLKVSLDEYGDTPAIDAFDRLRVSEPYTIFDSKQLHDKQPLFWDESIGGSSSSVHVPSDACTTMAVTNSASDFVIRQTRQRFNYQPGKSQLILMTFYSPQVSGLTKRVGSFSGTGLNNLTPNNGIFFECDGAVSWNIAKNGAITETVAQENWNIDKLDGTGPSAHTLDLTSAQILIIDYEWLGVGRVRVGFVIDGIITYVHYFNHANDPAFTSVYMSSPNLPLRYDIQSDGTAGGSMDHICSTIMSEGGIEENGVLRSFNTGIDEITATTAGTTYALLAMRLRPEYNDISVYPTSVGMMSINKEDFLWSVVLNPSVTGIFTYSDIANSSISAAYGGSGNEVTGGTIIASGYGREKTADIIELQTALRMGSSISGASDELFLCVTPLTDGAKLLASITYRELL